MKIKKEVIEQIRAHGIQDLPIEACGYLAGISRDNIITRAVKLKNIDNSPEHFSFDIEEQFKAIKKLRSEGLDVLGVYHTHPETEARMSSEDLKFANDQNLVYLIYSLKNDNYKCFRVIVDEHDNKQILKVDLEEV